MKHPEQRLVLSSHIYTRSALEATATAFAGIVDLAVSQSSDEIIVHIRPLSEADNNLFDEFLNHVLALSVEDSLA